MEAAGIIGLRANGKKGGAISSTPITGPGMTARIIGKRPPTGTGKKDRCPDEFEEEEFK